MKSVINGMNSSNTLPSNGFGSLKSNSLNSERPNSMIKESNPVSIDDMLKDFDSKIEKMAKDIKLESKETNLNKEVRPAASVQPVNNGLKVNSEVSSFNNNNNSMTSSNSVNSVQASFGGNNDLDRFKNSSYSNGTSLEKPSDLDRASIHNNISSQTPPDLMRPMDNDN